METRRTSVAMSGERRRHSRNPILLRPPKFSGFKSGFNQLSISARLILLVLALALPLNLVIGGVIWDLIQRANEAQRTSLLYTARSIAAGVDAELGTYVALAQSLARSPALIDGDLRAFEAEARRAIPTGADAWVLVSDLDGQQLLNTLAKLNQPLPIRNPVEFAAQQRAFSTRSVVVSDLFTSPLTHAWVSSIDIPVFKDGQPFRGLAIVLRQGEFLKLLSAREIPRNWLAGIIDGEGRFITRVPSVEIGQFASQGWRAFKDQTGVFEHESIEGNAIITANTPSAISNWRIGVAVKKAELHSLAWSTVHWAAMLGIGLSVASLGLAWFLARQITQPIEHLRRAFANGSAQPVKPAETGPPELLELQHTLQHAVSERTKASRVLSQTQRMDALGQLTGGIAHDFNNLLTVIIGSLELSETAKNPEQVRVLTRDAHEAAMMGARLTNRLLTFSRQRKLEPVVINLNEQLVAMLDLLRRSIGETVTVSTSLSRNLALVRVDPSEIENAVLNLAVNARDAMIKGGKLIIETENVSVDPDDEGSGHGLAAGEYVRLSVSDTGSGMPPEVVARAFEPFFTTKPSGQGTGLGLASIYGFVTQSGGNATIYSEPGRGTTVNLYLPQVTSVEDAKQQQPKNEKFLASGETVLVVEDNPEVRKLTIRRLNILGYRTLVADTGPAALAILGGDEKVDLIFSDVVMPGGLTGYELAERVKEQYPAIKILLTSGYDAEVESSRNPSILIKVLRKPYSQADLAKAVRDALAA